MTRNINRLHEHRPAIPMLEYHVPRRKLTFLVVSHGHSMSVFNYLPSFFLYSFLLLLYYFPPNFSSFVLIFAKLILSLSLFCDKSKYFSVLHIIILVIPSLQCHAAALLIYVESVWQRTVCVTSYWLRGYSQIRVVTACNSWTLLQLPSSTAFPLSLNLFPFHPVSSSLTKRQQCLNVEPVALLFRWK